MFVRRKKNKSGSVSIQVIDKSAGMYRVVETVGSSSDPDEIEKLWLKGKRVASYPSQGQQPLISIKTKNDLAVESFIETLTNASIRTIGPELIFGTLFDRIGFGAVDDILFRHLVISRLAFPVSKLKTVDYLSRYTGEAISVDRIYRFLDILQSTHKKQIESIAYHYTKDRLKGNISVVFYDMTTLYFEAEDEDDLRKIGFSKDGKFQNPQIMLGLLVGEQGLPIGYDVFEGNTFEGHTLIPILTSIQNKYEFGTPIVVADAALLSKKNLKALGKESYKFIIGGRIKNESKKVQEQILQKSERLKHGDSFSIKKKDGTRLVVTYSDKRAKKDKHNREKGIKKLTKRIRYGHLTKDHINNRGYNKFLTLTGAVTVSLDEEKIQEDKAWDGLKGYITNTRLRAQRITENYSHLWQIEKAFRISKTDLKVRPIHHYRKRRIEAHISIAFVAYTIYKELELLLKRKGVAMSARRAAELTQNMYQIHYSLPDTKDEQKKILTMDTEQKLLYEAVGA
jgi:transposase